MARKDRMETDTTEFVNRVLDEFPVACVKDRGRLCGRVTTAVARAEWSFKSGEDEDKIFEKHVDPTVAAVGQRCLNGIYIDPETRRTTCGLEVGGFGKLPFLGR